MDLFRPVAGQLDFTLWRNVYPPLSAALNMEEAVSSESFLSNFSLIFVNLIV
jgi:hypothetical protein